MSIGTTEEQRGLRAAIVDWAARTGPITGVRASEPGTDAQPSIWRKHWPGVAALALPGLALPEDVGGAGGDAVDLAVALEQTAAALVPGPLLPTVLAGLVLTDGPATARTEALLPGLAEGRSTAAVALDAGGLVATKETLLVSGRVGPVLGAPDADHLVLCAQLPDGGELWFLADTASAEGLSVETRVPVDFSRSLADVRLDHYRVSDEHVLPGRQSGRVRELAATLGVAEAAGVADWCLRTATEYAKVREQFGRPIGSFQSIKHLLVEMLCRVEQAGALAWDAARALADRSAEHPFAVASAAAFALDAAVDNAKDCVQVLGGIGFTWEHDAHLYLRRALALRALLSPGDWRRRTAELALAGQRRSTRLDLPTEQDGELPTWQGGVDQAELRALAQQIASLPAGQQRTRLAETGLLAPHWPVPFGRDATPAEQLAVDAELAAAGVSRPDLVIGGWAAPTILRHGTPEQRDRFVGPTLRGEITWCQLFSEPGAGSDLAVLRTRAVPAPDGWRLSGQKVWTSLATVADWAICLARTDPDAPKHKGISYFLVDMRSPGIDVRPLREITGDVMFNEVFLDDVLVPADCLVGPLHGGWRLARTTLANERVAMTSGSSLGDGVEALLALARDQAAVGQQAAVGEQAAGSGEVLLDRLGGLVATALATAALDLRTTLRSLEGREPGPESSVRKLVGVAHRQAVAEAAVDLFGEQGATQDGPLGPVVHEFLLTRCLSIAGGTTQILRTLAAERILGLPREPSG
ncbi:MAG TPA: acyl-CoA dehydrogenase [Pseudonocardiaceae bacterium]|jgi:alkylation response protein AidB-like acyl-CoA dehydrogenase|nr:acyl-CoA dehydrogenase [Pseudonocardiaceae bacterium]